MLDHRQQEGSPDHGGGLMALTYGAVHVVVVPLRRRENLSQVWAEGWWNAFTLDEPDTRRG